LKYWGFHIRNNRKDIPDDGKKKMRIISWINYHEYGHKEYNDWKKESSALVDMGNRKDSEERKSVSVHPS
jgi:hypothetical protein